MNIMLNLSKKVAEMKRYKTLLFLCIVLATSCTAPVWAQDEAPNLVTNAGFEEVGEDGLPVHWTTWLEVLPEPGSIAVDDAVAYSGTRSLRISHQNPNSYSMMTQRVEFEPNKQYVVSFRIKGEEIHSEETGCARVFIGLENNFPFVDTQAFRGTFDWRFVEIGPFDVGERTWLTLIPYLHRATGTVWFDDIAFREVTEADKARRAQIRARRIASTDLDIVEQAAHAVGAAALYPEITELRSRLDTSDALPTELPVKTPPPWFELHEEIFRLMARVNQAAWAAAGDIPAVDARWVVPFADVHPVMAVSPEETRGELLEMLRNETETACLRLTNLTIAPQQVSLRCTPLLSSGGGVLPETNLTWRDLQYVELRDEQVIADPLVRIGIGAGPVTVTLPPGMTSDIWLMVKSEAVPPGTYTGRVIATAGGQTHELPLSVRVYPIDFPEHLPIHTFAYAYTFWSIIKDRIAESRADLIAHHINTYVFQRYHTPWIVFDEEGNWQGLDWEELDKQIALHPDAKCLLLIPKLFSRDGSGKLAPDGGPEYASDEWKALVARWAHELAEGMQARGFDYDQWALYFVDEPSGERSWDVRHSGDAAHMGDQRIRIFANPYGSASDADMEVMAPAVDIWCPMLSTAQGERLEFCRQTADEVWMYQVLGKNAHPLQQYRLGFWEAFEKDLGGYGFWCYGDISGSAWDAYDHPRHDYGVIYDGDDTELTPSRRWEGYREGAEDYAKLMLLAESPGWDRERVSRLARRVLEAGDAESVQSARRRVIRALAAAQENMR